jgi:hypothetical protein
VKLSVMKSVIGYPEGVNHNEFHRVLTLSPNEPENDKTSDNIHDIG